MPQEQIDELPLRIGGDPLSPRIPIDEISHSGQRLVPYRFPNGVVGWLTTNQEDFKAILADERFHAKRFLGEPQPAPISVEVPDMPGFIPSMNGPEHLAVRRLAAGDFSVKRMLALRPYIDSVVDKYLDQLAGMEPPVDLIEAFCLQVPSEVIAHILGVPREESGAFQKAANETIGGRSDGLADPDAAPKAVAQLHEIIGRVIALKRAEPADDLITRLIHATTPPLSDVEIAGLCTNLLLAGHDTTAANSAMALTLLLEQPEQLKEFIEHPERVPDFVEELVRFNTMISETGAGIPRLVTEDLEYADLHFDQGEWVLPSTGLANVDPTVCPYAAGSLDLNREPVPHLSFGYGAHTCLGQHLARAELQSMLSRLLARFPTIRLETAPKDLRWNDQSFVYRMAELPVSW